MMFFFQYVTIITIVKTLNILTITFLHLTVY